MYTEIPTQSDNLFVPPAFNQLASVVAPEGTAVNINLHTSGDYVTTLSPQLIRLAWWLTADTYKVTSRMYQVTTQGL